MGQLVSHSLKAMSHGELQHNSIVERCKLGKYASSSHFANVFFSYQTVFTN